MARRGSKIQHLAKRTYHALALSGYPRVDFRMDAAGEPCVLEASPNPQLAEREDFAVSAGKVGKCRHRVVVQ